MTGTFARVRRDVGRVVEAEKHLLPPRRRFLLRVKDLRVHLRLREPRARRDRAPAPGVMRAEVPRGRAAHREARDGDAQRVDRRSATARPPSPRRHPSRRQIWSRCSSGRRDADRAFARREVAFRFQRSSMKGQLGELVIAPREPDEQRARRLFARLPIVRHDEAVRLHRAVDLRAVAAHHRPGRRRPRRLCRP